VVSPSCREPPLNHDRHRSTARVRSSSPAQGRYPKSVPVRRFSSSWAARRTTGSESLSRAMRAGTTSTSGREPARPRARARTSGAGWVIFRKFRGRKPHPAAAATSSKTASGATDWSIQIGRFRGPSMGRLPTAGTPGPDEGSAKSFPAARNLVESRPLDNGNCRPVRGRQRPPDAIPVAPFRNVVFPRGPPTTNPQDSISTAGAGPGGGAR
jgi:hypothetical protein